EGHAGDERPAPLEIDRVIARLHPGRLEHERHRAQARVGEQVRQPARADATRPDVLVAVRPRSSLRARVVEVDHLEAPEPELAIEAPDSGAAAKSAVSTSSEASRNVGSGPARLARYEA